MWHLMLLHNLSMYASRYWQHLSNVYTQMYVKDLLILYLKFSSADAPNNVMSWITDALQSMNKCYRYDYLLNIRCNVQISSSPR